MLSRYSLLGQMLEYLLVEGLETSMFCQGHDRWSCYVSDSPSPHTLLFLPEVPPVLLDMRQRMGLGSSCDSAQHQTRAVEVVTFEQRLVV